MSNEALARHEYTGMWKLTLLCGCVQLLGKFLSMMMLYSKWAGVGGEWEGLEGRIERERKEDVER